MTPDRSDKKTRDQALADLMRRKGKGSKAEQTKQSGRKEAGKQSRAKKEAAGSDALAKALKRRKAPERGQHSAPMQESAEATTGSTASRAGSAPGKDARRKNEASAARREPEQVANDELANDEFANDELANDEFASDDFANDELANDERGWESKQDDRGAAGREPEEADSSEVEREPEQASSDDKELGTRRHDEQSSAQDPVGIGTEEHQTEYAESGETASAASTQSPGTLSDTGQAPDAVSDEAESGSTEMPPSGWSPASSEEEPPSETPRRQGAGMKETTELPGGAKLRHRVARDFSDSSIPQATDGDESSLGGAPMDDESFLRRAAKREEKAAKQQARDEARRMREEAKQVLERARKHEKAQAALEAHMEKVELAGSDLGYDPGRPITRIPELPPHMEEVSFRAIQEDRAYIRMAFDTEQNSFLYQVIEPVLTPNEEKIKAFLRDTLIRTLDGRRARDVDWHQYLRQAVQEAIVDHDILADHVSTERILYHLLRDFLGFGPIDVLMQDDQLEDISCDGPEIPIYVFHRQHESIRTDVQFDEDLEIDSFVIRLAQRSGKHISIADPLLDATLPDGSRLQATLSREVTSRGSSFTIRKFREDPFTPPDLIDYGTVTTPMCAYFWFMMEEGRSLLLAGGTASGKTTTLNATCQFIPPEKKIVSIEDTREINLLHENWIAGITRSGFGGENIAGKRAGTIDMYRLLEAALRQRPEYLLVGEVRGPEALTLFQAMATGHAVYSTMHADSAKSAVYRLENPPINVPRMMLQTLDTVAIQSQVRVRDKMQRRIREVVEIIGFDPDTDDLLTNTVFYWDAARDRHVFTGHSGVFDQIQDKKGWSDDEFQEEWERRMLVLEWLRHRQVNDFREFSKIVHEYYQRPEKVMARIAQDGFTLDKAVAAGSRAGDTSAAFDKDKPQPPGEAAPWKEEKKVPGAVDDEEPEGDYVPPWKQDDEGT